MLIHSYRSAILLYMLLFAILTAPFWGAGEVIAPFRQYAELGAVDNSGATSLENRKFSDFALGYIPTLTEHLQGLRSNWLVLWTNANELGRPVYHLAGFSPAYPPSWLLAQFTQNPWQFITILSFTTCFLSGLFILLFCREINLRPLSALIAGTSLATSPFFMYWLTFPMFPSIWCWSAGILWAVTRLAKRRDLLGWIGLAFSSYSLLMTAYPQPIVFHAYLFAGYTLYLCSCRQFLSLKNVASFAALVLSALLIGALLAVPAYHDLAILTAESARITADPSFFTVVLPKFSTLSDAIRFFSLSTVPELFGNPIAQTFPFSYDGLSITPLVLFLLLMSLLTTLKQTWGWWLAVLIFCLPAFIHPLYVMGVKYLGFNLSRSTPIGTAILPCIVLLAHAVDALIKRSSPHLPQKILVAAGSILLMLAVALAFGHVSSTPVHWPIALVIVLLAGSCACHYRRTHPWLLLASLVLTLAVFSYPLILRQNPEDIATTSPLVKQVRTHLPPGSRFAVAAPGFSVLRSNLNAGLQIPSLHSYNSLSSTRYHRLIKELGGEMLTYGRHNDVVSPDYTSAPFWISNIGLILAPNQLTNGNLEYIGEEAGVHLHKVRSRMGSALQVVSPQTDTLAEKISLNDPRILPHQVAIERINQGDLLEFEVAAKPLSSFLMLSQKFHRDWQAQAHTAQQGWQPAQTVEINGIFQGVLVPPDTQRVQLAFQPLARYAWLGHVVWFFLFTFGGIKVWKNRQSRRTKA